MTKKIQTLIAPTKWLDKTRLLLSNGTIVTTDPNETGHVWKNKNKFKVIFQNTHPDKNKRLEFLEGNSIEVDPNDYIFLPHKYFTPWESYINNKSGGNIVGESFQGKSMRDIITQINESKNG